MAIGSTNQYIKMTDIINPIEFCKKEYPEMMKEFEAIQAEDFAIFCRKQMDYGPNNISMGTNLKTDEDKRLSTTGIIIRMNDKMQRLLNLVVKTGRSPQNESVEDAFLDLGVYSIISRIVNKGKWAK